MEPRAKGILDFWIGEVGPARWYAVEPELDSAIRDRFGPLWEQGWAGELQNWISQPEASLALVILLDQFPRNMFRGHADQFATDPLALAIARQAIEKGFDGELDKPARSFLYMPFQHSEDLDDQKRSLLLFTQLGNDEQLKYAKLHHDIIERFGRFPHRNAILGRPPRADEVEAGELVPW